MGHLKLHLETCRSSEGHSVYAVPIDEIVQFCFHVFESFECWLRADFVDLKEFML